MKLENLKAGQEVLVTATIMEVDKGEGENLTVKIGFLGTANNIWINHNLVTKILPHEFKMGDLVRYRNDKNVIVLENDRSHERSIKIVDQNGLIDWVDCGNLEFIKKGALNWD